MLTATLTRPTLFSKTNLIYKHVNYQSYWKLSETRVNWDFCFMEFFPFELLTFLTDKKKLKSYENLKLNLRVSKYYIRGLLEHGTKIILKVLLRTQTHW